MGGYYGLSPINSSFLYARQLSVLQRAAGRLGLVHDEERWGVLISNVTRAFKHAFTCMQLDGSFSDNANGRGTQAVMGSQALALAFLRNTIEVEPLQSQQRHAERRRARGPWWPHHGFGIEHRRARLHHPYSGELSLAYLFDEL
jgi:hypothetical protein